MMNPSPPPFTNPSSFTFLQPTIPNNHLKPDLPTTTTTLSILKNLLTLSHHSLHSLSSNLLLSPPPNLFDHHHPILISCPFNPHHRIPPHSLFRHSLRCPFRIDLDLQLELESLRYPHTLAFSPQSQHQNYSNSNAEEDLCFSLADYYDEFGGSNFFYRDCPGVVSSFSLAEQDSAAKWMFTLPAVLSVECANVVASNGDREMNNRFGIIDSLEGKLLASDFWAIRREVEMWSDYPNVYSYVVLSAMCSRLVDKESDLKRWVIVNSPRYGVVIDEAMRDHIFLLLRLSLKAIVRESFGLAEMMTNRKVNGQLSKMNLKSMSFQCPVLVKVLKWLASQLSVLYGEANGKMFAINMCKQCLLTLASGSLLNPMEHKEKEHMTSTKVPKNSIADINEIEGAKLEFPIERSTEQELGESDNTPTGIFVYQVASAVAALHERAWLEEKIKALRLVQPFTRYQKAAEHSYVSKRAEEERQKRSNYRSILEHDGLLMQRSYNQDTSKTKTREELLAEERDYKRRRMSYHGKKLKRTRTQVMRDIINEYMEEIKRAGGIGCFVKGSQEGGMMSSELYSVHNNTPDKIRSIPDSSDASKELLHSYTKQSHSVDMVKSFEFEKSFSKDYERKKQHSRRHSEHHENLGRNISSDGRNRKYNPGSPDGCRSHVWLDEQSNCRSEQSDMKVIPPKHDEDSRVASNVSKFHHTKSLSSTSGSMNNSNVRKSNWKVETKDTRQKDAFSTQTSNSVTKNTFDDRYDPSEYHHDYSES